MLDCLLSFVWHWNEPQSRTLSPHTLVARSLAGESFGLPSFRQFSAEMIVMSEPESICSLILVPLMLGAMNIRLLLYSRLEVFTCLISDLLRSNLERC